MKPILKYTLIGLLVAAVAGISVVGVAYAQGDDPRGREAIAELLGLTVEELQEQLQDGKTIQELAEEAGVDLEAFREEMSANKQVDLQTRIEEALANGDIDQDQADWLMEGLEKGYLDGPFFGMRGRGAKGSGERPNFDGERPNFDGERPSGMRGGMSASEE